MAWRRCGLLSATGLFVLLLAAPAAPAAKHLPTPAQWLRAEKVRCLSYLSVSKKTEEHVRRTRQIGFNCALSIAPDGQTANLMPLAKAADKYGLRIIWVNYMLNQFVNPALKDVLANDKRRFVGADGRVSLRSPCPTDPVYWEAVLLNRALPLARLAAEGHPSSAGLLLDIEDYAGTGDWNRYCHCEECFASFCRAISRTDGVGLAPEKRHSWLVEAGLWTRYTLHQDEQVVKIFAGMRQRVHEVSPDFLFAFYPWVHVEESARGREAPWDERLAAGLGTERTPFLIFDEGTYAWGYEPRIELWSEGLKAKGLHFVAVSGFNLVPAERVWWPDQMALHAYYSSMRSGGYWIYVGEWAILAPGPREFPAMWGGTPEEWASEFARMNRVIADAVRGKPAREKIPLPPLPPRLQDPSAFQIPDLFSAQHSPDSVLRLRRWSDIGQPWEDGELVLIAKKAGEWYSFERDIRRTERFEVAGWLTLGPDRGLVQLFVGGQPCGEPVDLYAPIVVPAQQRILGRAVLPGGRAKIELRVVGKNPGSGGHSVGLIAMDLEQVGWPPEEWNVILPFDNTGEGQPGFSAVYAPERETRLDATYEGKGGTPARWQVARAEPSGYLNFLPLLSGAQDSVAYALVYVHCPTAGLRSILLGSDAGGKLWVNDEFVWGENLRRSAERDDDRPIAFFRTGWNKILMKVTHVSGGWGLYFRIYDPDHSLRYALQPERR